METTVRSLQLNLSTTTRSVDGLSTVFADNIGINNITIFGPTAVPLLGLGGGGVTGFDIWFDFRDDPYFYDPSLGNLLIDFQVFEGVGPGGPPLGKVILDGFNVVGDSVSSVYASTFDRVIPPIGQASSLGLATLISFQPIPEPSTLGLLAVGLGVLAWHWRRQRRG